MLSSPKAFPSFILDFAFLYSSKQRERSCLFRYLEVGVLYQYPLPHSPLLVVNLELTYNKIDWNW